MKPAVYLAASALALTVAHAPVSAQHMSMPGMTMPMPEKAPAKKAPAKNASAKKAAPKKAAPKKAATTTPVEGMEMPMEHERTSAPAKPQVDHSQMGHGSMSMPIVSPRIWMRIGNCSPSPSRR